MTTENNANPVNNLKRANKVTAYWTGTGKATAVFYKTHEKMLEISSDDPKLGFVMPEGTETEPITAAQKLEKFKDFVVANASKFDVQYDPVDRRADEFKFPSKYDEASAREFAKKMAEMSIEKVLGQLHSNVIEKLIKGEQLPAGTIPQYSVGEPKVNITEAYASGSIKYATVEYPVVFTIDGKTAETNISVEIVSGQMKKPRNMGETVLTMTGLKTMLEDKNVLPKKPEKSETKTDETANPAEGGTPPANPAPADKDPAPAKAGEDKSDKGDKGDKKGKQ